MGDDVASLPAQDLDTLDMSVIDPRDAALVRLGALLALDASSSPLQRAVQDAQLSGVSADEIVRCVVSLVPTLGSGRVSSVAPGLALAIGFDLDRALEDLQPRT